MVSVPYAFRAHEAETLGGLPASAFVQTNSGVVPPDAPNAPANLAVPHSRAGGASATLGLPISGSGKTNFIPIWTSSTTLENSALFQTGGNVGLGTTTPGAKLDVVAGLFSYSGGIRGTGTSYGLSGTATAANGFTNGVYGQSASVNGTGVFGQSVNWVGVGGMATATSGGPAYGVWGDSLSTSGVGVAGFADAASGFTSGVYGNSASTSGNGVSGYAIATSGTTTGVFGGSASTSGSGVDGSAAASSGYTQ